MAADFALLGATVPALPAQAEEGFAIWPENWPSLCAFLACETQWRIGPAGWMGLDYPAVDVVLRRLKFDDAVFADLQDMEREALAVFMEEER